MPNFELRVSGRPIGNWATSTKRSCPPPLFGGSFLEKVLTGLCLFVSLVLMNESQVRKARKQLLGELPDLAEIVRGSLLDRRIFHRRGCLKCRRGEGHRVWVLTVGYPGGRTRQFTVPAQHKGQDPRTGMARAHDCTPVTAKSRMLSCA